MLSSQSSIWYQPSACVHAKSGNNVMAADTSHGTSRANTATQGHPTSHVTYLGLAGVDGESQVEPGRVPKPVADAADESIHVGGALVFR